MSQPAEPQFRLYTHDANDPIMVGDLVGMLTMGAAITVVLSITYQMGYLAHFGLWLGDVPATITDYTIHALNWLPWLVLAYLALGAVMVVVLNFTRIAGAAPRRPTSVRSMVISTAALIVLAMLTWVFFSDAGVIYSMSIFATAWQRYAGWAVKHPKMGHELNAIQRRVFYYAPWLAFLTFGFGFQAGDSHGYHAQTAVIAIDGSATRVEALRSYERGVLTLHNGTVTFVRWDDVRSLDLPARRAIRGAIEYLPWLPDPPSPYQGDPHP